MIKNVYISKVLLLTLLYSLPVHAFSQSYKELHKQAIVIDGHNSILSEVQNKSWSFDSDLSGKTQSDLHRMMEAGIDVQVFSVWCDSKKPDSFFSEAIQQIDTLYAWVNRRSDQMALVLNVSELYEAIHHQKLGVILAVEGGHMTENDMNKLDSFYKRGVRILTLIHEKSPWGTSTLDEKKASARKQFSGLNDFGKEAIQKMNQLGMIVDLSHAGEQSFFDAINTSVKPVVATHSAVYNLCPVSQNLKDEQIKAIAKNGGLVMLPFAPGVLDTAWIKRSDAFAEQHKQEIDSVTKINPDNVDQYFNSKYKAELMKLDQIPISKLIDHIDYIVKLVGVDYVGLGSGFDGMMGTALWQGLNGNGVLDYPQITKALLQRGYHKKEIEKMLGGNFIRVFKANTH